MINLIGGYIVSVMLLALHSQRKVIPEKLAAVEHAGQYVWFLLVIVLSWVGLQQMTFDPLKPHQLGLIDIPRYLLFGVTLWIHEAGHLYFLLFGRFMHIAGGTLNQLIFPGLFCLYSHRLGLLKNMLLGVFWMGFSWIDISRYAGDARALALPLLGTDQAGHDWHNMLSAMNLLTWDHALGRCFYSIGVTLILGAIGGIIVVMTRQPTAVR